MQTFTPLIHVVIRGYLPSTRTRAVFQSFGSFQALSGKTWNNFALYGPYLVVRNAEEAAVYRLPLAN